MASASRGRHMTRFHATIGKLQTTLCADPTARQISAMEPSDRVKVNVVFRPGWSFSMASYNSRVNCPTPHCICGPAPRNSALYSDSALMPLRIRETFCFTLRRVPALPTLAIYPSGCPAVSGCDCLEVRFCGINGQRPSASLILAQLDLI